MTSKYTRLDRFVSQKLLINKKSVKFMLASNKVLVDGIEAKDCQQSIGPFHHVVVDGVVLQAKEPQYWMLHKPKGVVSATKDDIHQTVLDLLPEEAAQDLHIAGRLDLQSTGLVLLTNDGRWSKALSSPESSISKQYYVTVENPLDKSYIAAFAAGMYFSYEDVTTAAAKLTLIDSYHANVELTEGRYHQIKRMFGRFRNPVIALHRHAIGNLELCSSLEEGQSRQLSTQEVLSLKELGQK